MYLYLSLEFLKLPWAIQLAMEGYLSLNQFKNKQKKAFTLQIHISSLQYSSKAKDHPPLFMEAITKLSSLCTKIHGAGLGPGVCLS